MALTGNGFNFEEYKFVALHEGHLVTSRNLERVSAFA
jgi:hypothetical protein